MLYAIEWIRQQLSSAYQFAVNFLEALTLRSIGDFLTRWPILMALCLLAGTALVFVGFRCHKLISGLAGGAVMGYFGWQLATTINTTYISSIILLALIFAIIGTFICYMLYIINVSLCIFFVSFALARWATGTIMASAIVGAAVTIVSCILLLGRPTIRTSLLGGALLALICSHYFVPAAAISVFVASAAGGIILQARLRSRYEKMAEEARNFRPNAPIPPTPEEIAAEIAEEEAERAARRDGRAHNAEMVTES